MRSNRRKGVRSDIPEDKGGGSEKQGDRSVSAHERQIEAIPKEVSLIRPSRYSFSSSLWGRSAQRDGMPNIEKLVSRFVRARRRILLLRGFPPA
jgi:hypothetical protein